MATIKKYNGSTWENTTARKYETKSEIITPPTTIYADGSNITIYTIKGNTVQNGTPTPDNPVMPQGTGERTENLINVQPFTVEDDDSSHQILLWSGILPTGTYTISLNQDDNLTSALRNTIRLVIGGTNYYEDVAENYHLQSGQHKMTFSISDSSQNVEIRYWGNALSNECSYSNIMLNLGNTPLPYEPYGYKIPISSASTTTNVYLGEVQSTRRVKKQVVTISRIIESVTPNTKVAIVALDASLVSPRTALSTVLPYGNASTPETFYYINANNIGMVGAVGDTDEQITAKYEGSILYYGIAKTTGIVNEPLMKIGNYTDIVSGITVPTITGKDTFDVETTLKPSEVSLSYTGWHDATVEEWDGSQWNE